MKEEVFQMAVDLAKTVIPKNWESKPLDNTVYVKWGMDNTYPSFLLSLFSKCPMHQSCINTKASYIIGDGLRAKSGAELGQPNPTETMDEFIEKVVKDFLLFNSYAVECQYNELTYNDEVLAYNHVPIHKLRTNKEKTKFWYSEDWVTKRSAQWTYDVWQKNNPDSTSKLFWFDGYTPTSNLVYPEPDYNASIESIVTDMAIRTFNRNNITSNFSPSKLITYYIGENVPQNIQDDIRYKLEKYFSGAGEKYMLIFANPGQEKMKVDNIDANTWDKAYEVTKEYVKQDIYEGHSINPILIGRETSGKLGNTQEIELSYEIFKSNYINSKRRQLEKSLSQLFGMEVEFVDKPLFKSRLSDDVKKAVYTINELRQIEGLPPIPDGDKVIPQNNQPQVPQPQQTQNMPQPEVQMEKLEYVEGDWSKVSHFGQPKELFSYICDGNQETLEKIIKVGGEQLDSRIIQLVYDYRVKASAAPVQTQSRPFCQSLESANKYYTRPEIQQMSQVLGYDVYKYGGHWYKNPQTGIVTESCRHEWVGVIVQRII